MKKIILSVAMAVLLASAVVADAENRAKTFNVTPFLGGYLFDGSQHLTSRPISGLRLGYNFTDRIGAEAAFDFTHTTGTIDQIATDLYHYRVDLLYHLMPKNRLDPFFAVGLGGVSVDRDNIGTTNKGSVDYGLGVNYFINDIMAIRADVRHIIFRDAETLNNLEYGLGLSVYFGGVRQAPVPVAASQQVEEYRKPAVEAPVVITAPPVEQDSDNDGVPDSRDKCPGTPAGAKVDSDGCPIVEQRLEAQAAAVAKEMFEKGRATIAIEFDFDKADIKSKYHQELKKFGDVMKNYRDLKVVIEGHTDSVGGAAYNQKLSEKRANSVRTYLIKTFGIEESRLTAKGYGTSKPIANNKTVKGRQKNRRVEAVVDYTIKK